MNESNEYKNGYNACCEEVLKIINSNINNTFHSSDSIKSVLLKLKEEVLKESFR